VNSYEQSKTKQHINDERREFYRQNFSASKSLIKEAHRNVTEFPKFKKVQPVQYLKMGTIQ